MIPSNIKDLTLAAKLTHDLNFSSLTQLRELSLVINYSEEVYTLIKILQASLSKQNFKNFRLYLKKQQGIEIFENIDKKREIIWSQDFVPKEIIINTLPYSFEINDVEKLLTLND